MTVADPHGSPRDWIRRCYSSWMRVPDHDEPIRVRWYWVPEDTPWPAVATEYGSSNYDTHPGEDYPLGEISWRRDTYRDWADGSPPPWPETVPAGAGTGLASSARLAGRVGSGLGQGAGFGLGVSGYTRVGYPAGYGAGLGTGSAVYSRVQDGAGEGSGGGVSLARRGRSGAAAGVGAAVGSSASAYGRTQAGAGTAAGLGTSVSLSGRVQAAAGTGSGLGAAASGPGRTASGTGTAAAVATATARKEVTPGCAQATATPYQVSLPSPGATNAACADCTNLNTARTLTWTGGCTWTSGTFTLCGAAGQSWSLVNLGGNLWHLQTPSLNLVYSVTLGAAWTGRTPMTLTRVTAAVCTMPLTLTITPV